MAAASTAEELVALDPQEFRAFPLVEVFHATHNTKTFRFELPTPNHVLGLHTASCIVVKATIEGEDVMRPYTPVSSEDTKGYFDLIIKRYEQGRMSRHIHGLEPGDTLLVKGPFSKVKISSNMKKHLYMLAGGTGITPMYQVLLSLLSDPQDETKIDLLYSNSTPEDLILHEDLLALEAAHPRLKVTWLVSHVQENHRWSGQIGRIDATLLEGVLPSPSQDTMVLVCGPPPFMESLSGDKNPDKSQGPVTGVLGDLGWDNSNVYKF